MRCELSGDIGENAMQVTPGGGIPIGFARLMEREQDKEFEADPIKGDSGLGEQRGADGMNGACHGRLVGAGIGETARDGSSVPHSLQTLEEPFEAPRLRSSLEILVDCGSVSGVERLCPRRCWQLDTGVAETGDKLGFAPVEMFEGPLGRGDDQLELGEQPRDRVVRSIRDNRQERFGVVMGSWKCREQRRQSASGRASRLLGARDVIGRGRVGRHACAPVVGNGSSMRLGEDSAGRLVGGSVSASRYSAAREAREAAVTRARGSACSNGSQPAM